MSKSLKDKKNEICAFFSHCADREEKYSKIIELGKASPPLDPKYKIKENIVHGCQSTMYMHSFLQDEKMFFETESDALISSGLAILLTKVYNGETPESVLKNPPDYLDDLEISASLTPSRANGLYSIHLRMKQEALKQLI